MSGSQIKAPGFAGGYLLELSKSKPRELSYASSGSGSTNHLITEMFKMLAGIALLHVSYKSAPSAMPDLVAGRVPIMFINVPVVLTQIRAGRLRALAVASAQRSVLLPNVPTIAESGFPGFDVAGTWYGALAPARTPKDIVAKLNRTIVKILRAPEATAHFSTQGLDLIGNTPAEFALYMTSEILKWRKVVTESRARVD